MRFIVDALRPIVGSEDIVFGLTPNVTRVTFISEYKVVDVPR